MRKQDLLMCTLGTALMTLVACAAPAAAPLGEAPAAEEAPAAAAGESEPDMALCLDEWPKYELCPEDIPKENLTQLNFTQPEQVGDLWSSTSTYVNQDGESFSIEVLGASEAGVAEYTGQTTGEPVLACFDMIVRTDCSANFEVDQEFTVEQLSGEDVAILIQPKIKEESTEAFFLSYVIDPRISRGSTHYYPAKNGTRAYVTVAVRRADGGEGSVSAGLCRSNANPLRTTSVDANLETGSISDAPGNGISYSYRAGVRDTSGWSRYRISSLSGWTGWYAGYYDLSPAGAAATCRP